MKILVTGTQGQMARAMKAVAAAACPEAQIILLGRPQIDLTRHQDLYQTLVGLKPDVIVNAAAYTAVDQADSDETQAFAINAEGATTVAAAAATYGAHILQLSTDYVFDGRSSRPYREDDATGPLNAYGRSKAAGERGVANANPNHLILRTSWIYSPFGKNFARTMLHLAQTQDRIRVVDDQKGAPTSAFDLARAIITIALRLVGDDDPRLRGIFHISNAGEATWAHFAQAVLAESASRGMASAHVEPISSHDFPAVACRPSYSVLDNTKLEQTFGLRLPFWRESIGDVVGSCIINDAP